MVGADGAFSKVREALTIPADIHLYPDGYLIAMLESKEPVSESFYYVGHRQILGLFPATGNKVYLFYMIPSGSYDTLKQRGMRSCAGLDRDRSAVCPSVSESVRLESDRLYADREGADIPWVADGAVFIGDAAHAMNPMRHRDACRPWSMPWFAESSRHVWPTGIAPPHV